MRFRGILRRIVGIRAGESAYRWVLRDLQQLRDLDGAARLLETMRVNRLIAPQLAPAPAGKRILVIAPHPDDEVIGPGGALIQAARDGAHIRVLYLTSGSTAERGMREAEARAVCARLNFESKFLGQPARNIALDAAADSIAQELDTFAPDQLFVPFLLDDNDDHRRASEALIVAVSRSPPSSPPEVWAFQVYTPLPGNIAVDITAEAGAKSDAIRLYASQFQHRDWAHFALGLNAFNSRLVRGRPQARYIEAFFVVPLQAYCDFGRPYFSNGKAYYDGAYCRR